MGITESTLTPPRQPPLTEGAIPAEIIVLILRELALIWPPMPRVHRDLREYYLGDWDKLTRRYTEGMIPEPSRYRHQQGTLGWCTSAWVNTRIRRISEEECGDLWASVVGKVPCMAERVARILERNGHMIDAFVDRARYREGADVLIDQLENGHIDHARIRSIVWIETRVGKDPAFIKDNLLFHQMYDAPGLIKTINLAPRLESVQVYAAMDEHTGFMQFGKPIPTVKLVNCLASFTDVTSLELRQTSLGRKRQQWKVTADDLIRTLRDTSTTLQHLKVDIRFTADTEGLELTRVYLPRLERLRMFDDGWLVAGRAASRVAKMMRVFQVSEEAAIRVTLCCHQPPILLPAEIHAYYDAGLALPVSCTLDAKYVPATAGEELTEILSLEIAFESASGHTGVWLTFHCLLEEPRDGLDTLLDTLAEVPVKKITFSRLDVEMPSGYERARGGLTYEKVSEEGAPVVVEEWK